MDGVSSRAIECHFLDVGQASCTVILLGGRRGIVIDLPQSKRIPMRFIAEHVDTIEALVLTHNDRDHASGFVEVYENYRSGSICRLRKVCFLADDPQRMSAWQDVTRLLASDLSTGIVGEVIRLEVTHDGPRTLWADDHGELALEVLYPSFLANVRATRPNETSGILRLRYGDRAVMFTGDTPYGAIEEAARMVGGRLRCDILTVPHHGGVSAAAGVRGLAPAAYLEGIYASTIAAHYGVISVGTSNDYGHPSPLVVRALGTNGVTVLCTQITPQCADDLEAVRPGVLRPTRFSRSSAAREETRAGRSKNLACASSVVALLTPGSLTIERLDAHQSAVRDLCGLPDMHPLCCAT